jgi:hypothetical protein
LVHAGARGRRIAGPHPAHGALPSGGTRVPRDGLFARDIVKSLLRDGLTGENAALLADLINEIEFPRDAAVPVLTARSVETELPAEPTPGYLAFLGRRGRYEERLIERKLILENYVRDSAPWFRMVLSVG